MDKKQELIIDVAQKCFNKNGIKYTSIDDIVKECKISKSTFYKYFSTKENLIEEILKYSLDDFSNKVSMIDKKIKKDAKESLKEKLYVILEYIGDYRCFNFYILEGFSQINGKSIIEVKNRIKRRLVNVYYDSLIDIYGEEIKPFIWELIFIIDSIIHEFNLVARLEIKILNKEYVAGFIIRQIEWNITNLKSHECMIRENILYKVEDKLILSSEKHLEEQFEILTSEIVNKARGEKHEKKITDAVYKIVEEYNSKNYNSLMMDAMIAYLENIAIIETEMYKLKNTINELGEENGRN